jgi:hemoglobin-like flavoprotein
LFPKEMAVHQQQFMLTLAEIVLELPRPYALIQNILKPLGRQHAQFGIQPDQIHTFAAAWRLALADTLGSRFTAEVEEAWMDAYYLIIGVMKEA